jgi:hypothetical protein
MCDSACVDTSVHPGHCGGCNQPCAPGNVCDGNGTCALSCQAGLVDCNGTCINPLDNRDHCGAGSDCSLEPGTACSAGEVCDGTGSCALSCQSGLIDCDDKCIDPAVDPVYCGATATCQGADAGVTCDTFEACVLGACEPLSTVKRVFASSVAHDGNFGGLVGADAFCQGLATTAGLPGIYEAWLSDDSGSPSTRFTHSAVPYVLVDGTPLAADWADLTDGNLLHPIDQTEVGGTPAASSIGICGSTLGVWSNTTLAGATHSNNHDCQNWTSTALNSYGSSWGKWTTTDFNWYGFCGGGSCAYVASVYCFEQ